MYTDSPVIGHVFAAAHVHRENLETVWVSVNKTDDWNCERCFQLTQEQAGGDIRLAFSRDDDAWILRLPRARRYMFAVKCDLR